MNAKAFLFAKYSPLGRVFGEELFAHYEREIVRAARAFDVAYLRTRTAGRDCP